MSQGLEMGKDSPRQGGAGAAVSPTHNCHAIVNCGQTIPS